MEVWIPPLMGWHSPTLEQFRNGSDAGLAMRPIVPRLQFTTARYQACNDSSWDYDDASVRDYLLYIVSLPWCFVKKNFFDLIGTLSEAFSTFLKLTGGGILIFCGGFHIVKLFLSNIRGEALEMQRRRARKALLQLPGFDPSTTSGQTDSTGAPPGGKTVKKSASVKIMDYIRLPKKGADVAVALTTSRQEVKPIIQPGAQSQVLEVVESRSSPKSCR